MNDKKQIKEIIHDHKEMERHEKGVHFCSHILHAHLVPVIIRIDISTR